jgi:hypothetical protein
MRIIKKITKKTLFNRPFTKKTLFNRPFTLNGLLPTFLCIFIFTFLIYCLYLQYLQIEELQTQIKILESNLVDAEIKEKKFFYLNTKLMLIGIVMVMIFG